MLTTKCCEPLVLVFFQPTQREETKRFLVLGFYIVVAMVLDEGDGVALPMVSNSETRDKETIVGVGVTVVVAAAGVVVESSSVIKLSFDVT
ncbi:hypothetical protein Tco_1180465 [Tanacetum coccineum]